MPKQVTRVFFFYISMLLMTRADICCEIIIIKLIKNPRRFSTSRSEEDKITISLKNFFVI